MKNYRKHIDDFFREKLGNYTETPPPEVWEDLEKRLDGLQTPISGKPYRWMWHFAMVSLILLFGLSLIKKSQADNSVLATAQYQPGATAKTTEPSANNEHNIDASSNAVAVESKTAQSGVPATNTENANQNQQKVNTEPVSRPKSGHFVANTNLINNRQASNRNTKEVARYQVKNSASALHKTNKTNNTNESSWNSSNKADNVAGTNDLLQAKKADVKTEAPPLPKKEEKTAEQAKSEQKNSAKTKNSICRKFEFGVKMGYETGMNNDAASKYAVAPYVYYKLGAKLAVGIQPAIKYASINSKQLNSVNYYQIKSSSINQVGESDITTYIDGGTTYDIYKTKYNYKQTHDSIVKTNTMSGSYIETELPVMLKYAVSQKLAVYGGLNVVYSQATTLTERTTTVSDIVKSADVVNESRNSAQPLPIEQVISYTGQNTLSEYGGAIKHTTTNDIRMGFNAGVTYNLNKHWLVDAMIQKNQAKQDIKAGYDLNSALSATYLRLSIGYKLSK